MRHIGKSAFHALLAMWVMEMVIEQWNVHTLHRGLVAEEEPVNVGSDRSRRLVKFENYELLAGGFCADSNGKTFDALMYFGLDATTCASKCDEYETCHGFDVLSGMECRVYFYPETIVKPVFPEAYPIVVPGSGGEGDIVGSDNNNMQSSCFFKRRIADDGIDYLENYENIGTGDCEDSARKGYSSLAYYLGGEGTVEDCAEKCDGFTGNLGFTWRGGEEDLCLCHFNAEDLPFDPDDPETLTAIPGASPEAILSAQAEGECEITQTGTTPDATCYVNKNYPGCSDAESDLLGGFSGDPLFLGLHGQVFKFEGRSGAWYSNVSTKTLQWNLRFKEFDTCPKDENMFVTGTTITLYAPSGLPFKKPEVAHTISVIVIDEDTFFPGCQSGVCLGDGSLKISLDGKTDITSPGDYELDNDGGRVIAHNTFSACSRKWYDYVEHDTVAPKHNRLLEKMTPLEFLNGDKGNMLDPKKCMLWMKERGRDDDLFSQEGGWSTIHIKTPTISFHVEYRQDKENCNSHNIDAWISEVSPVLLDEDWQGVLGETREPKFYPNGKQVTSERSYLLNSKNDKDYEVDSPFGKTFAAQTKRAISSNL